MPIIWYDLPTSSAARRVGNFLTPRRYAELAHEYLSRQFENPSDLYACAWWDPCCGEGILTAPCPPNTQQLFLSTLEEQDASMANLAQTMDACVFANDFLDDDAAAWPQELIAAFQDQNRWVFIFNPPFGGTTTHRGEIDSYAKSTAVSDQMAAAGFRRASHVLAHQFMFRVLMLVEEHKLDAVVGIFHQAPFLTQDSYRTWRDRWTQTFEYQAGFAVSGEEFGAKAWPLVFSAWRTRGDSKAAQIPSSADCNSYPVDLYDQGILIGKKTFGTPTRPLSRWIERPILTVPSIPLTSAVTVDRTDRAFTHHMLPPSGLGFCAFTSNSVAHSERCFLLSAPYGGGAGWGVTEGNFEHTLVALAARCLMIRHSWHEDQDQFSEPDVLHPRYDQWKRDAVVWFLASNYNHTSSFCTDYNGVSYDIRNHFFWMSPEEISAQAGNYSSTARDVHSACIPFVAAWLQGHNISPDASDILTFMRHAVVVTMPMRADTDPSMHLDRWDAGWYQIRNGLLWHKYAKRRAKGIVAEYRQFKKAHTALGVRLRGDLREIGFLPKTHLL